MSQRLRRAVIAIVPVIACACGGGEDSTEGSMDTAVAADSGTDGAGDTRVSDGTTPDSLDTLDTLDTLDATDSGVDTMMDTGSDSGSADSSSDAVDAPDAADAVDASDGADAADATDSGTGVDAFDAGPGNNIVFVTSASYKPLDFGSPAGADTICAKHATAAGLPGTYRAWLGTDTTTAVSRLGTARGWVRVDGKAVADTTADLTASNILNPIRLDENGAEVVNDVWTGTTEGGKPETCKNWSSSTAFGNNGHSASGNRMWMYLGSIICSFARPLYCFQVDKSSPLVVGTSSGKRAFLTEGSWKPPGGLAGADAFCATEATAAKLTGTFKALLPTSTASAASRFDSTATYVRLDGQVVAKGTDFFSASKLESGVWQSALGSYVLTTYWTGASSPSSLGDSGGTCSDWTSTTGSAKNAITYSTVPGWYVYSAPGCSSGQRLLCVES